MTPSADRPLLAVDIGNTRLKLGRFDALSADGLPEPVATLELPTATWDAARVAEWLDAAEGSRRGVWRIASVHRPAREALIAWIRQQHPGADVALLRAGDLPLVVDLPEPERVGLDRLLGGVAANRVRDRRRAALVVDLGSAITVDRVEADGRFTGGAILPGIGMSARALHEQTDLLPASEMTRLEEPPPALGRSTAAAIRAGLFWGAVGAVRELAARLSDDLEQPPELFLTGGAAPSVADLLGPETRYAPHLVLAGIALAADR